VVGVVRKDKEGRLLPEEEYFVSGGWAFVHKVEKRTNRVNIRHFISIFTMTLEFANIPSLDERK
jgi:hypothetical protein